jgi:hypothetical protein
MKHPFSGTGQWRNGVGCICASAEAAAEFLLQCDEGIPIRGLYCEQKYRDRIIRGLEARAKVDEP